VGEGRGGGASGAISSASTGSRPNEPNEPNEPKSQACWRKLKNLTTSPGPESYGAHQYPTVTRNPPALPSRFGSDTGAYR
jgi:hypothetical protein